MPSRFRMGKKSRVQRGWDLSKWPLVIGALLTAATQLVSMRGQLIDQEQKAATTTAALVAMQADIAKLSGTVFGKRLEPRIAKLERPAKTAAPRPVHVGVSPDSIARSRGMLAKVARVPAATWGIIKRMFQGGTHASTDTQRTT